MYYSGRCINMKSIAHTYFPKAGAFVSGEREQYTPGMQMLAASRQQEPTRDPKTGEVAEIGGWKTNALSASLMSGVRVAKAIKAKLGQSPGMLAAADVNLPENDFLLPLIQVRLHQQIMGQMQKWFHLDNAFTKMQVDQLYYRMPFQDNPAAAQIVGPREQYDVNKVKYYEAFFELKKAVNSYDIAWEDKLRATIDFEPSLKSNLDFSIDYLREIEAANTIVKLGGFSSRTDTSGSGGKMLYNHDSGTFVANNGASSVANTRINPDAIDSGGVHSDEKTVDLIQEACNKFTEENDMFIDTCVGHPKAMMKIAGNTWTETNTIFNVEAFRTNGGVRQFPGLTGVQFVASLAMPNDRLFFFSKNQNVMVQAEGPKQYKSWDDPTRFRRIDAQADFFQYKYMLEDTKPSDLTRIWGFWTWVNYA